METKHRVELQKLQDRFSKAESRSSYYIKNPIEVGGNLRIEKIRTARLMSEPTRDLMPHVETNSFANRQQKIRAMRELSKVFEHRGNTVEKRVEMLGRLAKQQLTALLSMI